MNTKCLWNILFKEGNSKLTDVADIFMLTNYNDKLNLTAAV